MRLNVALLLIFSTFSLYAVDDIGLNQTQQRIRPIGQVHIQAANEKPIRTTIERKEAVVAKKDSGNEVYEKHCIVCHRDGLAGAPKLNNENDWKPRLVGRTIQDLVVSSIKGLNAMPIRGTCIECMDKDLEAAIQYMLPKS